MKSLLLAVTASLAIAGSALAQNLPPSYRWEVGVNGGYSIITRPAGPPEVYKGNTTNLVKDYSLRASYYFNWRWMMSLDVGNRRWESTGEWDLQDRFGKKYKTIPMNFLIASHAVTTTVSMNYVIPFYTQFTTFNRANLYFGAMAGMVNTINDGSRAYSRYSSATDSSTTYVSGYNYSAGMGYTLGLHTGFIYYIVPRFGVSAEAGIRYVNLRTNDQGWAEPNNHIQLAHFPATVGIRWRIE